MQRNVLLLLLLLCLGGFTLQAQEQQSTLVYFALDSDQLNPEMQKELDLLWQQIETLDRWQVGIRAHTDASGTNAYNDDLARRRAEAVQLYLLKKGLPMEQLHIAAFGEHRPTASNETEDGRSLNRRVEVTLQYWPLRDLRDLTSGLNQKKSQFFTFPAEQSTSVTGSEGTTVYIPSDLFEHADGSKVLGEIELEMQEAYTYADMVAMGLSTHSGQQMLETGGMVYLQARSEGQDLRIREGGELIVGMPSGQQLPGMQLFTGVTDADGNVTDWEPTGQDFQRNKLATLRIADPPAMPKIKMELAFFRFDKSGEPVPPSRPYEPVYPREPKRESVKYNPGFFKKLVMGKKKIQAREEEMYAKKVAQYEERLTKYPEKMKEYEFEMEAYAAKMIAYKAERVRWEVGLQEQWQDHRAAWRKKYDEQLAVAEAKYRRTMEAYEAYKARKIAAYEAEVETGQMDQRSLNNYFFTVNKLGWINCDRFYNLADAEKEQLMVRDVDEQEELIFVLFTDMNSALRTQHRADEKLYVTQMVPTGASAKVVGLKVKDGRSMLAVKEVTVGASGPIELEYEPAKLADIRQTLADL
ncbi:MAG: OmpA family protein [Saprospiraceae bacterium]|nr:OmpA family protein [Lewinella sp.]